MRRLEVYGHAYIWFLLYLFSLFPILCLLEEKCKQAHKCIHRWVHRYTEIAWTFSSTINMRRVICCNHAQSIASCSREHFHILWVYHSLYTQWRQFKCKSWHSHHSASRRLLYQKLPLHRPRSKWVTIRSTVHLIFVLNVCVWKCARNIVRQIMREKVKERKRSCVLKRQCLCMQVYVTRWCRLCTVLSSGGLFLPPVALSCPISHSNWKLNDGLWVWEYAFRSRCTQGSV